MIEITSIYVNPHKQYLVKRYADGTYYMNQAINGKLFYRRWTQTTAKYAKSLMFRFDGSSEKCLTLTVAKMWRP